MKFIERLFGKKQEKERSHSVVFEFGELAGIVKKRARDEEDGLKPVVRDGYEAIRHALKELDDLKKELLDAEPIENVSKRGEKIGDSNRDNLAHNLKLIQDKLKLPGNTSPVAASQFFQEAKSTLKTVLDNTSRSLMYIKAIYPQQYQKINQGLAELEDTLDELNSSIMQGVENIHELQHISEAIDDIRMIEEETEKSTKRMSELDSIYENAKEEMLKSDSRLAELESSKEFERAKELGSGIKEIDGRLADTVSEARRLFTPLSKAISRMEKQDDNERAVLSPENREILRSIKEDPVNAIEKDLGPFLAELTSRMEGGELGLKEQMREKTLMQVQVLTDGDAASSLVEQRNAYLAEKEEMVAELNDLSIYQEREKIEKDIENHRSCVDSTKNDIDSESKNLYSLKDDMERKRSVLLSNVRKVFGEESEIEYKA